MPKGASGDVARTDADTTKNRDSRDVPPASAPSATPALARAIEARGDKPAPHAFHHGARSPYAVRWFGVTSLFAHARHFAASAIASEQIDSRDWMRCQSPGELLRDVLAGLGGDRSAPTVAEGVGRPVWIDYVADTGDDRDVSAAVAEMVFARYTLRGRELPRGDILLFGGDTAYPVATVDEIYKRVIAPWNEVLHREPRDAGTRRVLLGIPGNHDWYDGLDGFARLFRRAARATRIDDEGGPTSKSEASDASHAAAASSRPSRPSRASRESLESRRASRRRARSAGLVARQLHLDELGGIFRLIAQLSKTVRALWRGSPVSRRKRLSLSGYAAVQECTYWALPLAPGLDAYAVDRQLGRLDFRQRIFFRECRDESPDAKILFVAPDPAIAFGERWDVGARMLTGCGLALEQDEIFYLTGDMHHYERRNTGASMHVIAGGGGAFLHGTRIRVGPGGPATVAYPTAAMSRRLIAAVPTKLMFGGAGFIAHLCFAFLASVELTASLRGTKSFTVATLLVTAALTIGFWLNAGDNRSKRAALAAIALPFGVGLGLLPVALRLALPKLVPEVAGDGFVIVTYAFLGAFVFGLFLTTIAIVGLEHQQAFSVLSHPGFKHFVRLCVHPDGRIEAFVIGKDDPIGAAPPEIVDEFTWGATSDRAHADADGSPTMPDPASRPRGDRE